MRLTPEEIHEIHQRENGRVGLEVVDTNGISYFITDVLWDGRIRVVAEDGRDYWWNQASRFATLIPKEKPKAKS